MGTMQQNLNIISKEIIFYCLIIFPFIALPLQAQDVSLTVTGVGSTKADAIIDAQRNALRASYGEFISANLTILNNELTKNETVNLVSGTIKDSKILSESVNDFSEPPMTEVLIQVTVNKGQLVSFAKAIGDSVEIQGSLYGAELQLQEINKRNEAIAMEHLVNKAENMPSIFNYKISPPDEPKLSPDLEDHFFIYSTLRLSTNQNFSNLMNAIIETISNIGLTPNERKKYDELNTPFYRLDILKIIQPLCGYYLGTRIANNSYPNLVHRASVLTTKLKRKDIVKFIKPEKWYQPEIAISNKHGLKVLSYGETKLNETADPWGYELSCTEAEVDHIFFRSRSSIDNLEKINDIINKNIIAHHVYRETTEGKKFMLPFRFVDGSRYPRQYSTPFYGYLTKNPLRNIDKLLREMVRENAKGYNVLTPSRIHRIEVIGDEEIPEACSTYWLCYKDTKFPEYALDINRLYSKEFFNPDLNDIRRENVYASDNGLLLAAVGLEIDPGIFWDDRNWVKNGTPNSHDNPSRHLWQSNVNQAYNNMRVYGKRVAVPIWSHSKGPWYGVSDAKSILYRGRLEEPGYKKQSFAQLIIYQTGSRYADVNYEDIVRRNKLSKLTGYSVELDK